MQCPCGCGRKVRFARRGAANLYEEAIGTAEVFAEQFGRLILEREKPVQGESAARQSIRESEVQALTIRKNLAAFLPDWLLEHIHGTPEPGTPSLMDLGGQVNEQREMLRRLMQGRDPLGF